MNRVLKQGIILALVVIIALQATYVLSGFMEHIQISQVLTSVISVVFAIIFILALVIIYQKNKVDEERKRFSSHNIVSSQEYDVMRLKQTKSEVEKLKSSPAYKQWVT